RDRDLFGALRGPRTEVWTVDRLLPRRMVAVPRANVWVNVRRPYAPARGWIMQQAVKLAAAAAIDADVLLTADSDVVLVRPVTIDTLYADGRIRFYADPLGVAAGMRRHVIWHSLA